MLKRVRALIAQAEHENTDPVEAATYRAKADQMMSEYAISEAQLRASRPVGERAKPGIIYVATNARSYEMQYRLSDLVTIIARHTRCMVRNYDRFNKEEVCWESKVYGYESDLRYFEMLYTTLRLHMLGALRPRYEASLTMEQNCYNLHNAGYNWLEIAKMDGWRKVGTRPGESGEIWEHTDGRRQGNHMVGSRYKRACYRAAKAAGTEVERIPAGGTETYRKSAAWGYVDGIRSRLREASDKREAGTELALKVSMDDLLAFFHRDDPVAVVVEVDDIEEAPKKERKVRERKFTPAPFSPSAYAAGNRHARTADLGGSRSAPGARTAVSG
jgi:hypothetical protein